MEELNRESIGRWAGARALSTPTAAIIMIVVILVVGGVGYVGLNATKSSPVSNSSCAPSTAPACEQASGAHDLTLNVPFKSVQEGNPVPFTAALPSGETATSYSFDFGDGATATQAGAAVSHTYSAPGTYIASVTGDVKGATHDSYYSLVVITVSSSFASASAGNLPGVAGTIVSNGSSSSHPTAILQPGGSATFQGTYSSAPTNPLFVLSAPWMKGPSGVTPTTNTSTNSSAKASFTFSSSGTWVVSFVGTATSGSTVVHQFYNWSVFVAPSGLNAGASGLSVLSSPHKGYLDVYELAPGGSNSEDPAIDYETLGYEPIINVYQQLIAYNGSSTGPTYQSYVPEIATCVPGSVTGANNCASLYGGDSLVSSDGNNYTFVISKAPQFYDPVTHNSWGVWPTDVEFSLARTMAFSTNPCDGCNNGWIVSQALLSAGNINWDGVLHAPLNNTPQNVFAAMTVNGTDCPASAMTNDHGCVTFHANANGLAWPYFLELIADPLGASIVPCGWFSAPAQGAGIPLWTQGNVLGNGDHPCGAPGSSGYGMAPSAMPAMGWDSWELTASQPPFLGNVQWHMAGSGPYYLSDLRPAASYALAANPAYVPNPLCTWTGCLPQAHQYVGNVSVTWETNQVPGEQAYAAGAADFASVPSTDIAFLLQLIQEGKVAATSFPSISIFFFPFNLNFKESGISQYTSNPVNVPQDWYSYVGIRQLFAHAYPYQTIEQTINTKDGLQFLFNYGGAIPQFMANYYPTNVSWPTGDPCSDATNSACAAYWWAQVQSASSPYYDPEVASCSSANPCQLPFFSQTGSPALDQQTALWAQEISTITGGAIKMSVLDINFVDLVINSLYLGPYNDPMPAYQLGWAPDYPDPTDYMVPLYKADSSYTLGDVTLEQMTLSQFNASSCTASHPYSDYTYWSNLAATTGIPNDCQGAAYLAMQIAMSAAAVMPAGPQRVLTYAEIEQIANALALYVYWGQQNLIVSSAAWIDPTTYNSNVTIGGGSDSTWFTIQGNGLY